MISDTRETIFFALSYSRRMIKAAQANWLKNIASSSAYWMSITDSSMQMTRSIMNWRSTSKPVIPQRFRKRS